MIEVAPSSPVSGSKRVYYDYDYFGRRVRRTVHSWNPTGGGGSGAWNSTADECQRTVYYNWLPLVEFDGLNSNAVLRRWTWGLDLAGLNGAAGSGGAGIPPAIDPAGGIGGLLATLDTNGTTTTSDDKAYIYFHDGNGNVGQLIDPLAGTVSASLMARYEYDAYGNVTSSGGAYAATNRMQFSTKPWDAVTGLGYWGYRWYSARLGRWISRDRLGEIAELALYEYVLGAPTHNADLIGLWPYKYTDAKPPCGTWKICNVTLSREGKGDEETFRRLGFDPSNIQGFTVEFFPTKDKNATGRGRDADQGPDCCCKCEEDPPGSIRLVQVIQSGTSWVKYVPECVDFPPDVPKGEGCNPPGYPLKYPDAPYYDGTKHQIEVCAVCDGKGTGEIVLGCVQFTFSDGHKDATTGKWVGRGLTVNGLTAIPSMDCWIGPSQPPDKLWKDGIDAWNEAKGYPNRKP